MKLLLLISLFASSLSLPSQGADSWDETNRRLLATYKAKNPLWTWPWNWGTGILLYGLQAYAKQASSPEDFQSVVDDFHKMRNKGPIRVMWSDQCAPAITALPDKDTENRPLAPSVQRVAAYLKEAKRNKLGSLDHFSPGSPGDWFFPSSIWLDSLVMWGVFALHYGKNYDSELYDFAIAQGPIYRQYLWSESDQLFYHAWNLEQDQPYPKDNTFWLRGNAWVMVYLVEALETLDREDPRFLDLLAMLRQLSQRLQELQTEKGLWGTLILEPESSYPESSGTALIAYALAKALRLGLLDLRYEEVVQRAWSGLQFYLRESGDKLYLGQISRGTNPGNRDDYQKIPLAENLNYGLGAYFLFASEMKHRQKNLREIQNR